MHSVTIPLVINLIPVNESVTNSSLKKTKLIKDTRFVYKRPISDVRIEKKTSSQMKYEV